MKKTILSIAVIAAAFVAASCQKEDNASEGSASVFTATIEIGAITKTTVERIDGTLATYKTKWESGDQIKINGEIFTANPDDTDKTKATFTGVPVGPVNDKYMAYFPADIYRFNDESGGGEATLPASYTYVDGKYNMPMYAESETKFLSFKNLCGVLAITVSGADFSSVKKIEVSSDQQMNGEFTAAADGTLTFKAEGVTFTDALKKVALELTSAKTIASDGSATFYIPVPANTHNPLTIKVTEGSTTAIMVTKKSGGVKVDRNTVYPIAFEPTTGEAEVSVYAGITGNKVKWTQLWAGGPKFAEYNVGVTDGKAESYGGYYTWGGRYKNGFNFPWQDDHDTNNPGTGNLTGSDDTVTYLWGDNWRMPTMTELKGLLDNCTVENVVNPDDNTKLLGKKFTGKDAYASNSVFLPAADYCDGSSAHVQGIYGYYWSSTPNGSSYAYNLLFNSGYKGVSFSPRSYACSVRAVLK